MPRRNKTAPHQPFQFKSRCQTKRRFESIDAAQNAAHDQEALQHNLKLAVYKCELCGGWHLTRLK